MDSSEHIINIYPINHYYFGSKDAAKPIKHDTVSDRIHRLNSNYAQHGMRTNVEAVLLLNNSVFKLPGGRLRPGELDVDGLRRKLLTKISNGDSDCNWKVGECLGTWWRSDFDTLSHRNPANIQSAKECTKLFIVHLPEYPRFTVPKYQKLIAVPLWNFGYFMRTARHMVRLYQKFPSCCQNLQSMQFTTYRQCGRLIADLVLRRCFDH